MRQLETSHRVLSANAMADDALRFYFDFVWSGEGANAEDEGTIARFALEVGLDAQGALESAQSAEGKARLQEQTARAIADGVFGVPTVLAGGEPFWGVEALAELDRFLAEGKPTLDHDTLARWSAVTPSAVRKRASHSR